MARLRQKLPELEVHQSKAGPSLQCVAYAVYADFPAPIQNVQVLQSVLMLITAAWISIRGKDAVQMITLQKAGVTGRNGEAYPVDDNFPVSPFPRSTYKKTASFSRAYKSSLQTTSRRREKYCI